MAAFTGPSWTPSPRFIYLASGVASLCVALLFGIGAIFFGQTRFGFAIAAGVLLLLAVPLIAAGIHTSRAYREIERTRAEGLPGSATVLDLGHEGWSMRSHPLVTMDLLVRVENRPSYRLRHRDFVPADALSRLAGDRTVPVRVDPRDPSRLAIEWERA